MSDCLTAVIVAAYIYLMVKGRHTRSTSFFIGILCILAMFITRIVGCFVNDLWFLCEIFLGVAFLCLVVCLPSADIDRSVSEEVKHILGQAFQKATENAGKSESNNESSS